MSARTQYILFGILIFLVGVFAGVLLALSLIPHSPTAPTNTGGNTAKENTEPTLATEGDTTRYTNEKLGLSFTYPDDWKIALEKTISPGFSTEDAQNTHYIVIENGSAQVGFSVGPQRGAGFALPRGSADRYKHIQTTGGINVWRSKLPYLEETQMAADATPHKSPYSIQVIFPELGAMNNVGNTINIAQDYYEYGDLALTVTYGFKVPDKADISQVILHTMDNILQSVELKDPKVSAVPEPEESLESTEGWHTFDKAFGYTFKYPSAYSTFTSESGKVYSASSNEMILISGTYNAYPTMRTLVTPMDTFKMDRRYEPVKYEYDKSLDQFVSVHDETGEVTPLPYDVCMNDWCALKVSFGDAGYFSQSFLIPNKAKGTIVSIGAGGYFGSYALMPWKTILSTFSFET